MQRKAHTLPSFPLENSLQKGVLAKQEELLKLPGTSESLACSGLAVRLVRSRQLTSLLCSEAAPQLRTRLLHHPSLLNSLDYFE